MNAIHVVVDKFTNVGSNMCSNSYVTIAGEMPQNDLNPMSKCFFRITQYNKDTHNVRTLTPMNVRT